MLVHLFRVEIGDEKADVIALYQTIKKLKNGYWLMVNPANCTIISSTTGLNGDHTSTGFLLRIKKCSALIIINRMNFLHKIFSISSALGGGKTQYQSHTYKLSPSLRKLAPLPNTS